MEFEVKYDVFVSYSRKDYLDKNKKPIPGSDISKLMELLDNNKISYWIDENGNYSGEEFSHVIRNAIVDSKMMVFVSSEKSNSSPWTAREIHLATKYKKLIIPFKIDNSDYNEGCELLLTNLDHIDYHTNPEKAFRTLIKRIKLIKDEYDKTVKEENARKVEEEAKLQRCELQEQIQADSMIYQRHAETLNSYAQEIINKYKFLGKTEKKCPICSSVLSIDSPFCNKCGYIFNPIYEIKQRGNKDYVFLMKTLWKAVQDYDSVRLKLEYKTQELESVINEKQNIVPLVSPEQKPNNNLIEEIETLRTDRDEIKGQLFSFRDRLEILVNSIMQTSTNESDDKNKPSKDNPTFIINLIDTIKQHFVDKDKEIQSLQKKLAKYEDKPKEINDENSQTTILVGKVQFNMIKVCGGTFTMGATSEMKVSHKDEKPLHQVSLKTFYIGETQVTQALWYTVMGKNPSHFVGLDLPVETVSWDECQLFITKLNSLTGKKFRLPTEAEWEFAARGGKKSNHTQFSGSNNPEEVAWFNNNSDFETHPVKTKMPNELGIYDMTGDVCEWCNDWYSVYTSNEQNNPTGPRQGTERVIRGGGYSDGARFFHSSCRYKCYPGFKSDNLGLRLVLDI